MRNVLLIILAKLRQEKSQVLSLFAFVFVAAMLLNLGLLLMLSFNSFFDERSQAVNAPHIVIGEMSQLYDDEHVRWLEDYSGVTAVETEASIFAYVEMPFNGSDIPGYMVFLNADNVREMNDLNLFEGSAPKVAGEICLPYVFKSGGYSLGDGFTVTTRGTDYSYTVSGFTEEIIFGSIYNQSYQVYLSGTDYDALSAELNSEYTLLRAQLEDPRESAVLNQDFIKEFFFSEQTSAIEQNIISMFSMPWTQAKTACTYMSNITSVILMMFAALVLIIALIVIRFRIQNSIEENMVNIGSLKAVGLSSLQLKLASALRFGGIALLAALAGAAASYWVLPVVIDVLEQQTALRWQQGFDAFCYSLSVLLIILAVLVVALFSLRKLRKLQPLVALRQGLSTHKFKKKHLPLDTTSGPLTWLLALKNIFQSQAQQLIVFIIVAALSFASVAGLSIYDNLGKRSDSFVRLLLGEVPDAKFRAAAAEDAAVLWDAVSAEPNVRKFFYCQETQLLIDERRSEVVVADSFDAFEGVSLYAGKYPVSDDEICLSGSLAELSGHKIGDTVQVKKGANAADYKVVGLIQTIASNGLSSTMITPGYLRMQPDFQFTQIYVYMDDSSKTSEFVEKIEDSNAEQLVISQDMKKTIDAQAQNYSRIFFWIAVVLVVVTMLMVFLVLYLMLKTVLLRQWRTLGIQKAVGFTTFQLMNQLVLYFIPAVAAGVVCGSALGVLGFNQLFVLFARNLGIMNASMPAPIVQTIFACLIMIVLAYLFIMFLSWRIRKISAYALITE